MVLAAAALASGCRSSAIYTDLEREVGIRAWHPPPSMTCQDGRPVKLLIGSACNLGICGWTCEADRWARER